MKEQLGCSYTAVSFFFVTLVLQDGVGGEIMPQPLYSLERGVAPTVSSMVPG